MKDELTSALRQYRHNNNDGIVFGYDKAIADSVVDAMDASIETISRLNTALTLQNERLEEKVLMLMEDIDVLNSIVKEARDARQ